MRNSMKTCGHEKFGDVRRRLEAEGKSFTAEEMRKLCYGDIEQTWIGNAGKAVGTEADYDLVVGERLARFSGLSPEELAKQTFCDEYEEHTAFQRLALARGPLPDVDASPEILLYRNLRRWESDAWGRFLTPDQRVNFLRECPKDED